MSKYSYSDVIIDPNDIRVNVGSEYWYSNSIDTVISDAKYNGPNMTLEKVAYDNDYPFLINGEFYQCLIRVPEDSYVPFDLNNEEDRAKIRGAWVRAQGGDNVILECVVISVFKDANKGWVIDLPDNYVTPEVLLKDYTFLDGTPCEKKKI